MVPLLPVFSLLVSISNSYISNGRREPHQHFEWTGALHMYPYYEHVLKCNLCAFQSMVLSERRLDFHYSIDLALFALPLSLFIFLDEAQVPLTRLHVLYARSSCSLDDMTCSSSLKVHAIVNHQAACRVLLTSLRGHAVTVRAGSCLALDGRWEWSVEWWSGVGVLSVGVE